MTSLQHEGSHTANGHSQSAAAAVPVEDASCTLAGDAAARQQEQGSSARECFTSARGESRESPASDCFASAREPSGKEESPACGQLQSHSQPPRSLPPGLQALRAAGVDLSYSRLQALVWALTFMAYTLYHASRKPLSIVKGVLHPVAVPPLPPAVDGALLPPPVPPPAGWPPFNGRTGKTVLGELDLAFLACYSFGMYFSGQLADRLDLRLFLAVGMAGSGLFACLFGMAYFWNVHSLPFFLVAHMLTGLLQSTGWPSVVAAMANWYGREGRGLVMGVWNAHTSLGNILGSLGSSAVLHLGWGWAFILPGLSIAAGGAAVYSLLPAEPGDAGFESPRQHELAAEAEKRLPEELEEGKLTASEAQGVGGMGPLNKEQRSGDLGPLNGAASVQGANALKDEDDLKQPLQASGGQVPRGTSPKAPSAASASGLAKGSSGNDESVAGSRDRSSAGNADSRGKAASPHESSPNGLNGPLEDDSSAGDADSTDKAALLQPGAVRSHSEDPSESSGGDGAVAVSGEAQGGGPSKAVGFLEAWRIPGVAAYAFCLFFAKLVAYTFLDWLPFYISHTKIDGVYVSDALAGVTSTVYDVGGVLGGIMAGYLADRFQAQALVSASFMVLAVPALGLYYALGHLSLSVNVFLLAAVGFCVNGPYALITCAVSADLGQHSSLKGNAKALSTVTGIIDGTGSLGAGLGPFLTGVVADFLGGWGGVFGMLMGAAGMSVLCVARLARAEWQALVQRQRQPQ